MRISILYVLSTLFFAAIVSNAYAEGRFFSMDNNPSCLAWNSIPSDDEKMTWSGECKDGLADGEGVLKWIYIKEGKTLVQTYKGSLKKGRRHGSGTLIFSSGTVRNVEYVNGKKITNQETTNTNTASSSPELRKDPIVTSGTTKNVENTNTKKITNQETTASNIGSSSPELKKDQFLLSLSNFLKTQDYPKAKISLEKLMALNIELSPAIDFFAGEIYFHTCFPQKSSDFLNLYYSKTKKSGRYYKDVLVLFNKIEAKSFSNKCIRVFKQRAKAEQDKILAARCGAPPAFSGKYAVTVKNRKQLRKYIKDNVFRRCKAANRFAISLCSTRSPCIPNEAARSCVQEHQSEIRADKYWFFGYEDVIDYLKCIEDPSLFMTEIKSERTVQKNIAEQEKQKRINDSFKMVIENKCKYPIEVAVIWLDASSNKWTSKTKAGAHLFTIQPEKSAFVPDSQGRNKNDAITNNEIFYLHYHYTNRNRLFQVSTGRKFEIWQTGQKYFYKIKANPIKQESGLVDTTQVTCK